MNRMRCRWRIQDRGRDCAEGFGNWGLNTTARTTARMKRGRDRMGESKAEKSVPRRLVKLFVKPPQALEAARPRLHDVLFLDPNRESPAGQIRQVPVVGGVPDAANNQTHMPFGLELLILQRSLAAGCTYGVCPGQMPGTVSRLCNLPRRHPQQLELAQYLIGCVSTTILKRADFRVPRRWEVLCRTSRARRPTICWADVDQSWGPLQNQQPDRLIKTPDLHCGW